MSRKHHRVGQYLCEQKESQSVIFKASNTALLNLFTIVAQFSQFVKFMTQSKKSYALIYLQKKLH
jgi:hypothetical protein